MQAASNAHKELAVTAYTGEAGSGKTSKLIEDISALLEGRGASAVHVGDSGDNGGGNSDRKILVLCASPLAAQAFERQAHAQLGAAMQQLTVTTARELALQILAQPSVVECNGREARMLSGASFRFLMEDMKTTSLKPKRLQEMLLFFYKSFTDLSYRQEDWLVSEEERMVFGTLQRSLDMRRAYIEPQLSAYALEALENDAALRECFAADHVFVDDYQTLSRASQLLACELADKSLTVSFDAAGCVEVFDSYPHAKGLEELVGAHPQTHRIELGACKKPAGIARALQLLEREAAGEDALTKRAACAVASENATGDDNGDAPAACRVTSAKTPLDEFTQLARRVTELQQSESNANIAVAVPNATWSANCAKALAAAGIASESPLERTRCIAGGNPTGDANARTLTLLRLIANPRDVLAWRDWCGFGDHLANSGAFDVIGRYAQEQGLSLTQAFEVLTRQSGMDSQQEESASLEEVLRIYNATKVELERMRTASYASTEELLTTAMRFASNGHVEQTPAALAELCLDCGEKAAASTGQSATQLAQAMCSHADALLTAPKQLDEIAVLIAPLDSLAGYSADALFITGLVNGFFPDYDYFDTTVTMLDRQAGVHQNDAGTLYALVGAAQKQLVASNFQTIDLEAAEKLRVKVARIYLEDGKRICQTIPSDFLAAF